MKTPEEIKQLAYEVYPRLINDPYNPMEDDNADERQIWIKGYTHCQTTELQEALEEIERVTQDFIKAHETIEKLLDEKINLSVEIERLKGERKKLTKALNSAEVIINNGANMCESSVLKNAMLLSLSSLNLKELLMNTSNH